MATKAQPASGTSTPRLARKARAYAVRASAIHGNGVFSTRTIAPGERIIEYRGERIGWDEALRRAETRGGPLNHTFFFSLHDGRVIDGGSRGNAARFINHSCEPNCEALEHDDGRVYLYALMPIGANEELSYDYALIYDGRHTAAVRRAFACRCGTPGCRGIMLAPKRGTPSHRANSCTAIDPTDASPCDRTDTPLPHHGRRRISC